LDPARPAALVLAAAVAGIGCEHRPVADPTRATPTATLRVSLPRVGCARWRTVTLSVARPRGEPSRPLVLHLTGDSGRHGLDLQLFTAVTGWGYPVALLSSPGWIGTFPGALASRASLARDVELMARAAARAAGTPEEDRFVILGQSRGAGLAVEAATDAELRRKLHGVVALGLCPEEEKVRGPDGFGRPYRDAPLLGELPFELIQSTGDHYMSAASSRAAFGPDTSLRAFHAIEAESHTFVGGREALLDQLRASLERVSTSAAAAPRARPRSGRRRRRSRAARPRTRVARARSSGGRGRG
jgi:dienelactone hydrolase